MLFYYCSFIYKFENLFVIIQNNRRLNMPCSHCKQGGHDRRTCESFIASEANCQYTIQNDRGSILRGVGWGSGACPCGNCKEYRRLNLPTPEIAVVRIAENHEKDQWPQISVENKTSVTLYIYEYCVFVPARVTSIDANDVLKINIDDPPIGRSHMDPENSLHPFVNDDNLVTMGPYDENDINSLIVTDIDFGDRLVMSDIDPKHVIKFITIEYGTHQEIVLTKNLSNEVKWRKAALKSRYLLTEMKRLGADNNPNLEPIIDLLQDIDFPDFSEIDKEHAGIPSELTNIT